MSIWQMTLLLVMLGCATGGLLVLWIAVNKLTKGISSIGAEIAKMNAKLESIEAVNKNESGISSNRHEPDFEDIEAAIANFEKLKRIDLTPKE